MAQMTRAQMLEKMERIREEIKTAGPIHKRDLQKHLKRMRGQIAQYDLYQRMARGEKGA